MWGFSRRDWLQTSSCGFGYLALAGLIGRVATAASATEDSSGTATLAPKTPVFPARAKRVIFLCMSGGPAQMDTFDYKPQTGKKPHPGSAFKFQQHGESGLWISELFPEVAKHADKLCMLNGMHCDTGNHAQSFLQLHTGDRLQARPSMGSWVVYGLGSDNQNLPGFISLNPTKASVFSSAFLPPIYQGTPIGLNGENMATASISNISSSHLPLALKRRQLDLAQAMNEAHRLARPEDRQLEGVIESMELGFRMQATAPEVLDLSQETAETLARYRVGQKETAGNSPASDFGRQCLLARRFIEAGVRFIELNHGSWDQHANHRKDLTANCQATDAPIAALLEDLHQRGLLDETLVVWGGEFGRPGLTPEDGKDGTGHNYRGFTFWLAGGGVKPGFRYGQTNETGSQAVEGKIHFRDLHATILHQLGLPHDRLNFFQGEREFRLTGVEGGQVVHDILS